MPGGTKRDCTICGTPFVGRNSLQLTCSPECSAEYTRRRNRRVPVEIERDCKVCGKRFVARGSSSNRVTCSDACSLENSREKSRRHARANYQPRENTRPERTCEECGVTYQPVRDNQKWCSGMCRMKGVDKAKPHRVAVRVCINCGAEVERKPGKPVCGACKVDKRASAQARERRRTLRVYGLTEADFDAMLAAQHSRCAICHTEDPGRKGWAIDHDHETGVVRSLLCMRCNTALGSFQDSPELLDAARRYLLTHRTGGGSSPSPNAMRSSALNPKSAKPRRSSS